MQLQRGTVVRSKAGHDKGSFFVVTGIENEQAFIVDGRSRMLCSPKKKKKLIHLARTKTVLSEQTMNDDSKIREVLLSFERKVRAV